MGMRQPAALCIVSVPYVTRVEMTWPKSTMACNVEPNMPRSTRGEASAWKMGTTTMVMPVMAKVKMRPTVNWAADVAEV